MKRLLLLAAFVAGPAFAQTAQVSSSAKTFDNNTTAPLQADTSGNLKVTATGANDTVAQGSTTSGQSGTLVQCAVTTAAPTYTTAQTDPMSCTTTGGLRTRAEDGSNIGLGSLADAAWTTGNGSVIALLKGIDRDTLLPLAAGTNIAGKFGIDQTTPGTTNGTATTQIGSATVLAGNGVTGTGSQRVTIASDNSAFSVNPTCIYNSTLPTLANTNTSQCQVGTRGSQNVTLFNADSASPIAVLVPGDSVTSSQTALGVAAFPQVSDGSTTYKMRGDVDGIVTQAGLQSTFWRYTSGTSPILSNTTTAVTIKGAAGAGVKIALDSCQIGSTALGASVPIAFRDGASGTVIWAMRPPAAGWLTPVQINFVPPLVGTANTLMEVVTTTADTSGTFDVNCQGHTNT